MLEASDCHTAAGVPPASQFQARLPCTRAARGVAASEADGGAAAQPPARTATPALYEMRTYQLILGYNPVPELRSAFRAGATRAPAAQRVAADSAAPPRRLAVEGVARQAGQARADVLLGRRVRAWRRRRCVGCALSGVARCAAS